MSMLSNHLSETVVKIEPSLTMSITALANRLRAEGQNVIGFGAGEPDFDTPEPLKMAAIKSIHDGKSKYTPAGLPDLNRQLLIELRRIIMFSTILLKLLFLVALNIVCIMFSLLF